MKYLLEGEQQVAEPEQIVWLEKAAGYIYLRTRTLGELGESSSSIILALHPDGTFQRYNGGLLGQRGYQVDHEDFIKETT